MRPAAVAALLLALCRPALAVPPLVAGDVPTADKGYLELYAGARYEDGAGGVERQIPANELVYGLSSRQELTFELPYLSLTPSQGPAARGFGDATVGTKLLIRRETPRLPGLAVSFEAKLDNAARPRGLGSGAVDYGVRLRAQKTWGWFTGMWNAERTIVGEPEVDGVRQEKRDIWFGAFAQQYAVAKRAALLSEIYWRNKDAPGEANRLGATMGFKFDATPHLQLHGSVGKSLRDGNIGGPHLRVYAGVKLEFALIGGRH